MSDRIEVRKTFKLFVNGAFIRSESGRTYEACDHKGNFLANVAQASRKDARDAVVAARAAQTGWSKATAYNRGQVVYRIAEVLESRRAELAQLLRQTTGDTEKQADKTISRAVDRLVWYAGWSDKLQTLTGANNPVAAPYFNFSVSEPTGVIAIVAPAEDSLLGLISVIAPAIISGNSVVVISSFKRPLPAIVLSEILATSDVPAGVVNILTGDFAELAPWLAEHLDVDGIDLSGVFVKEMAKQLEAKAAVNVKRVWRPVNEDFSDEPSTSRIRQWLETKTVWHPIGV